MIAWDDRGYYRFAPAASPVSPPLIITSCAGIIKTRPSRTCIRIFRNVGAEAYRVAAGQKTIKPGYHPRRRLHHFNFPPRIVPLRPLSPKLLLRSTYGRYTLSIQFRSHLQLSLTRRRTVPYVIFILFIVSRSHPRAWINIFLRDRALRRFSFRPYHFCVVIFLSFFFSWMIVGRAAFITLKMKLFGIVLSTESAKRRVVCLIEIGA